MIIEQPKPVGLTRQGPKLLTDSSVAGQLTESSVEKPEPGSNLSPQMQAEGEALMNELLQYLLQDLSKEGLDHLINRQTRRQQGKSFLDFNLILIPVAPFKFRSGFFEFKFKSSKGEASIKRALSNFLSQLLDLNLCLILGWRPTTAPCESRCPAYL